MIVPVRDRRVLVTSLLDALAEQTYRDFEVVVVDDGSTDGADAVARAEKRFAVRVLPNNGRGAVAARDLGARESIGSILAFTDSDCAPAPGWLDAGVDAINAGADVVMGRTVSAAPRRLLERSLTAEDNGLYPTCNVFYRRSSFEAAGGFDSAAASRLGFRPGARAKSLGFGEDTVLAWRVGRAGRGEFAPDAVVAHAVFPPDLRDHFSRTLQAGAFPALVKEVPELRHTFLRRGYFLGSLSRLPLYAVPLAVIARSPTAVAGALGAWGLIHAARLGRRDDSIKRRLLAFPIVLATDAVTAGALVVGSLRARVVVL